MRRLLLLLALGVLSCRETCEGENARDCGWACRETSRAMESYSWEKGCRCVPLRGGDFRNDGTEVEK